MAVYAAPGQTVIAGPPEQVDAVIAVVDAQGRLARRVEVDVASHHPTIDPILPELRSALVDLAPTTPKIPLISTVGQTNGAAPTFDADYWVTNLRNPVRFSQAVAAAGANHSTFIEVTPHPLLTHAITESLEPLGPRGDIQVAATLYRDNPRNNHLPYLPGHGSATVSCDNRKCRRRRKDRGYPADAMAAFEVLDGIFIRRPTGGWCSSVAGNAR